MCGVSQNSLTRCKGYSLWGEYAVQHVNSSIDSELNMGCKRKLHFIGRPIRQPCSVRFNLVPTFNR